MTADDRDLARFVRHRAWLSAPVAEIDVTPPLTAVTFCPGQADLEVDPDPTLSIGAHRYADELLITSLVLLGGGAGASRHGDVVRLLLGPTVTATVAALRDLGGRASVTLGARATGALVSEWNCFLRRSSSGL